MNPLFTAEEAASVTGGIFVNPPERNLELSSVSTDTRKIEKGALFLALTGEKFDAHDYLAQAVEQGASMLCIAEEKRHLLPPGVPALLVKSTVQAYQALAHRHRMRFPALHVIALTGSCGKTSTKETLRAIFQHAFGEEHVLYTEGNTNNQIGLPQNLLRLREHHKFAILEMGTNHPGEIEPLARCAEPEAAMIVSIGNCHLEFLGSLEGVAREKSHIFCTVPRNGFAVIPENSPANEVLRNAVSGIDSVRTFGSDEDAKADFQSEYLGGNLYGSSFRLVKRTTGESATIQWSVPGKHQACNAAGAAAMADAFGIPLKTIAEGISKTALPGMRMRVTEHRGSTWINDAYNANPDSMRASLAWLSEFANPEKLLLVLGDMGEIGGGALKAHAELLIHARTLFPETRICAVGENMTEAFRSLSPQPDKTAFFSTPSDAADFLRKNVRQGDLVFLKASRSVHLEIAEQEF